MEPPTMLIAAFEVKVRRGPVLSWFGCAQREIAGPGLEPDVQNVHLFFEFCSLTMCTLRIFRKQSIGLGRIPCVSSRLRKQGLDSAIDVRVQQRLATLLAQEHRDRHTPDALPR